MLPTLTIAITPFVDYGYQSTKVCWLHWLFFKENLTLLLHTKTRERPFVDKVESWVVDFSSLLVSMHFSATQKIKYLWKYEGICNSTIWWELCTPFYKLQYCELKPLFCKTLWICARNSIVKTYVHISFSIVAVEVETTFDVLGCQKLLEVFQSNIIVCLKLS